MVKYQKGQPICSTLEWRWSTDTERVSEGSVSNPWKPPEHPQLEAHLRKIIQSEPQLGQNIPKCQAMPIALELLLESNTKKRALEHRIRHPTFGANQKQQWWEEMVGDRLLIWRKDLKCPEKQIYSIDRKTKKNQQMQAGKIPHLGLHFQMQTSVPHQPKREQGSIHQPNLQLRTTHRTTNSSQSRGCQWAQFARDTGITQR